MNITPLTRLLLCLLLVVLAADSCNSAFGLCNLDFFVSYRKFAHPFFTWCFGEAEDEDEKEYAFESLLWKAVLRGAISLKGEEEKVVGEGLLGDPCLLLGVDNVDVDVDIDVDLIKKELLHALPLPLLGPSMCFGFILSPLSCSSLSETSHPISCILSSESIFNLHNCCCGVQTQTLLVLILVVETQEKDPTLTLMPNHHPMTGISQQ